jgi:uncharacterized protein YjbJ (UPF0337 family)
METKTSSTPSNEKHEDHLDARVVSEPHPSANESSLDRFSKSSLAAKLSGSYNEAAGLLKRKLGEWGDDPELKKEGRDQEFLGKVHSLVGEVREIRELALEKIRSTRRGLIKITRLHGGKFLDGVSSFIDDVKKNLF